MNTTVCRDRIQFEDSANRIDDGNEQMHRDACARAWADAATKYLTAQAHGGGEATVRLGRDHYYYGITGDPVVAALADAHGWQAVDAYVAEQIAELAANAAH